MILANRVVDKTIHKGRSSTVVIDSLKLNDETATALVALAIEFETYSDDMPETKKDRLEAAHETVTFAIDAYKDDGIRADAKDKDTAEAGEQVEAILKTAGVSIDDDGDIEYKKPLTGARLEKLLGEWDLEVAGDEDEDEDEEPKKGKGKKDDDEAAFEIDDIIDGYEEMSPASKIKAIKKLDLDPEDEDDAGKLNDIADWEEDQDKPASRVLSYIEELLGEEEDGDGDEDEDEEKDEDNEPYTEKDLKKLDKAELKEVAEEFEVEFPKRLTDAGKARTIKAILEAQEGSDEGEEVDGEPVVDADEEPWEGYDDASLAQVKKALRSAAKDEDEPLEADQVEYVIAYEKANEGREKLLDYLNELLEELGGESEEEEPEEEEEKPKRGGRRGGRSKASSDPDDSTDAEDAKERDDEKESRRGRGKKESSGLVLTREQILEALETGEVTLG